jgi:tetratricopeptide (TPR) repeat protein
LLRHFAGSIATILASSVCIYGAAGVSDAQTGSPRTEVSRLLNLYASGERRLTPSQPVSAADFRRELPDLGRTFVATSSLGPVRARMILLAFSLEIASAAIIADDGGSARTLVEWACQQVRAHTPTDEFDRRWQLAATALLESNVDPVFLEAHLDHVRDTFPNDAIWRLAKAVAAEQRISPFSTQRTDAVFINVVAAANPGRVAAERSRLRDVAIRAFQDLVDAPEVGAEARVRLSRLRMEAGQVDAALGLLSGVEDRTSDASLKYYARLFRGRLFEQLARPDDARTEYSAALQLKPGAEAAMLALASLAFLRDDAASADQLTSTMVTGLAAPDPWTRYWMGGMRNWNDRLAALRELLQ